MVTPGATATLPGPLELAHRRAAFTLAQGSANGSAYDPAKPHQRVTAAGNSANFAPAFSLTGGPANAAGVAYAVYDFDLPNYNGEPVQLQLFWQSAPAAGSAYYALGNFGTDRWEWKTAPASNTATYPDITAYRNVSGHLFLAVALIGEAAIKLDGLQLSMPEAPVAALGADVDQGPAPLLVTFDASGSADDDGSITNYEWDFNGNNIFGEPGPEHTAQGSAHPAAVTYATPGTYTARVRVTDNSGLTGLAQLPVHAMSQPPVPGLTVKPGLIGNKPFSATFDASTSSDPDGTIVDYAWDFDGNSVYGEPGTEAAAAGQAKPAAVLFASAGDHLVQVKVTDNSGDSASTGLTITVVNQAPAAQLLPGSASGPAPLQVDFDASGSSDTDGVITDYEWDFNGNLIYNEAGAEAAARGNPTPSYTYVVSGNYAARVRVTDDDGATGSANDNIYAQGWNILTVDDAPGADDGFSIQLAVIGNKPTIVQSTQNPYSVRLLRSSTTTGGSLSDWTAAQILDDTYTPNRVMLGNIGGDPALSFYSDVDEKLYYTRSATVAGLAASDWITPVAVDSTGFPGLSSSLVELGSKPCIAYSVGATGDVRFARSANATGDGTWSSVLVAAAAMDPGQHVSLALVGANPAIAYTSTALPGLRYVRSNDNLGNDATDWSGGINVDIVTDTGADLYPSLSMVNFNPAVSYMDAAHHLCYARAGSTTGSGAWAGLTLDTSSSCGDYCSMLVEFVGPGISYYDADNQHLRYVSAISLNGGSLGDWTAETVESDFSCGRHCALSRLGPGEAAIAYLDDDNGVIKYAVHY